MSGLTPEELMEMDDAAIEQLNPSSLGAPTDEPVVETPVSTEDTPDETAQPTNDEPVVEAQPTTDEAEPVVEPEASTEAVPTGSDTPEQTPVVDNKETPKEGELTYEQLKEFHDKMHQTFKAGGSDMQIKSAEEAIALMQQGVGYTQRMQALAPHRKLTMMLERNGLADAEKLSLLIDVANGNPDAIRKLLADKQIDPMNIDTSVDTPYQATNHQVSDSDFRFQTQVEDVMSKPLGKELLSELGQWDKASQDALYQNPSDLVILHQHKQNGFYDRVAGEVQRYMTLGVIPLGTPYLQAYTAVAQELNKMELAAQNAQVQPVTAPMAPAVQAQPAPVNQPVLATPTPAPVAVRTAPTATPTSNVAGAVAPRQGVVATKKTISPEDIMNMSDAEIEKLKL